MGKRPTQSFEHRSLKASERSHARQRLHILLVGFLLTAGFVAVAARLVFIQGFQNQVWVKRAEREHEKNLSIEAERGAIYDRNGNILAMNVEMPSVYAIPSSVRDPNAASALLSPILNVDRKVLARKLREGRGFVWLGRKIDPEKAAEIEKRKLEGVGFVMESQRFYPKRALFGHLLGFAGLDNHGLEGIELKYDNLLRGEKGWLVMERDAYGKSIFPKGFDYIAPSRGKDLHLTVDGVIQYISERELDRVVEKTHAKGGTVIVMDPWTGAILSMAVRPRFNPNAVGLSDPSQWRNRAITDAYEPGSTFKIVTASAALEEKVVAPEEMINCEQGAFPVMGTVIHDHTPSGLLPFRQVIAKSSNIGTVKVAERLGEERLAAYSRAFGFGQRLGIDLMGESSGLVRETRQWSGRSLASVSIGQEVGVTALQMANAASVVANGGWLMTPHLVREVTEDDRSPALKPFREAEHRRSPALKPSAEAEHRRSPALKTLEGAEYQVQRSQTDHSQSPSQISSSPASGGRVVQTVSPQARRRVISERTAKEMVGILQGVVSKSGTAPRAAIAGYSVAGKTGTAQKIDPATGRYSSHSYVSSFVGFAPAEDPVVTILVMVDEPEGEAWGGSVAAPVFSAIGAETLHYLKTPPSRSVSDGPGEILPGEPLLTASLVQGEGAPQDGATQLKDPKGFVEAE